MCRSDTYHCAAVVFGWLLGWFHNMASEWISGHSTAHLDMERFLRFSGKLKEGDLFKIKGEGKKIEQKYHFTH